MCALVDPEATPRAALLEARLLAAPGIQWVERTNIEAVLREQQLQAAFGPQGVADRVRLKIAESESRTRTFPARFQDVASGGDEG